MLWNDLYNWGATSLDSSCHFLEPQLQLWFRSWLLRSSSTYGIKTAPVQSRLRTRKNNEITPCDISLPMYKILTVCATMLTCCTYTYTTHQLSMTVIWKTYIVIQNKTTKAKQTQTQTQKKTKKQKNKNTNRIADPRLININTSFVNSRISLPHSSVLSTATCERSISVCVCVCSPFWPCPVQNLPRGEIRTGPPSY